MKPAAPVTKTARSMGPVLAGHETKHLVPRGSGLTTLRGPITLACMDDKHYRALLEAARVSQDGPWAMVMDERTITLHVASGGVGLNIGKVVRLRLEGNLLYTENAHGEAYVLGLHDVFAGS